MLSFEESLFATSISAFDAMNDADNVISLEEAELEEDNNRQPQFGNPEHGDETDPCLGRYAGSVMEYINWFSDGEDSSYEDN